MGYTKMKMKNAGEIYVDKSLVFVKKQNISRNKKV